MTDKVRFRGDHFRGLLLFLACLTLSGVAQAAGGGDADHDPVKEAVFQGVNLLILLGLIAYFGRGPISAFFKSRREGIQTDLSEAAALLSAAEQRNAELQRRLVDLSSEVEEIREAASRRAEEESERILADARAAADRIRSDARAAVDQELRRAQTELREEAAELALEIAAKKLTDTVSEGDRERLMDEFITRVEPGSASGTSNASEGAN
ncbi:MAG: F0F1 ATP synthase subunit B [bacterium]|nr:F0F1 ATP synthase subunit B [bacterium]